MAVFADYLDLKITKPQLVFSLIFNDFFGFLNASPSGEQLNLASFVVLYCCGVDISSLARYSYLSVLPDDNAMLLPC